MHDDSGLTDHAKEMRHWNAPYVYREYPKMLFRGTTTTGGRVEVEQRIVTSVEDEALALGAGWDTHPTRAREHELHAQAAIGTAAAERAWDDRRLSPGAQAEATAVDAGTARHLGEIPAQPQRPARRRGAKESGDGDL
jgi:hypothetical protein